MEKKQKGFKCEGDQTPEQVAQRCCGVSILEDTQDVTGHSPREPALADSALSKEVAWDDLSEVPQTSSIQGYGEWRHEVVKEKGLLQVKDKFCMRIHLGKLAMATLVLPLREDFHCQSTK